MNDAIIKRIRTIINHYGLTVSTFADKVGVQRSSISHLLNGRNRPSLDFVLKVIQTYPEVNLYWLLNGKGEFPSQENPKPLSPTQGNPSENFKSIVKKNTDAQDDREAVKIVIFYSDGSFESFNAKKE